MVWPWWSHDPGWQLGAVNFHETLTCIGMAKMTSLINVSMVTNNQWVNEWLNKSIVFSNNSRSSILARLLVLLGCLFTHCSTSFNYSYPIFSFPDPCLYVALHKAIKTIRCYLSFHFSILKSSGPDSGEPAHSHFPRTFLGLALKVPHPGKIPPSWENQDGCSPYLRHRLHGFSGDISMRLSNEVNFAVAASIIYPCILTLACFAILVPHSCYLVKYECSLAHDGVISQ